MGYRLGNRSLFMPMGLALLALPILFLFNNCDSGSDQSAQSLQSGLQSDPNGDPNNAIAGKAHFDNVVKPIFENRCTSCHDERRFGGFAPLTIFNYADMAIKLKNGSSAADNRLINIMQNIESHDGGNSCPSGINGTPCQEVLEWRQIENPNELLGGLGALTFLSNTGAASGWARDPDDEGAVLEVIVFGDGPANSGTRIGTFTANEMGPGGPQGGHYFSFDLPANFRDGRNHQLYIYAIDTSESNLIPGMPRSYTAYTPTSEGEAYFTNTVRPTLNCNSCHVWDYTTAYGTLLSPTPAQGGSASNNQFINFSSGEGGHPGGNFCRSGKNSGLCSRLQTWWNLEFN